MGRDLQASKKSFQGFITQPWGLLLHPVARAWDYGGPAEIRAAGARIGVEIHTWDKVAHRVPLPPDKAAGLLQKHPVLRHKLLRI